MQGTGDSQAWWSDDFSCQFDQVLSGCGEEELVLGTAWSAQPQTSHPKYPLEMGKSHLDFLALTPGLFELRRAN